MFDLLPTIDIHGDLLSVAEVCRHPAFRRSDGRPCHPATVYRAFDRGLEALKCPVGGMKTSAAAIERYTMRRTYGDAAAMPTTASEKKRSASVDRQLTEIGIG